MNHPIKKAWQDVETDRAPAFADSWKAAEARWIASRRRYAGLASAMALIAVAVVTLSLQGEHEPAGYVMPEDLLCRTSWVAPSDAWLPEHQFDIYQELPTLTEST